MATVEAATGLLTAESIVIAAFALVVRHATSDAVVNERKKLLRSFGALIIMLTGISFLGSLLYLHAAEFPNGYFATQFLFSTEQIFTISIGTLAAMVYLSMGTIPFYLANRHRWKDTG